MNFRRSDFDVTNRINTTDPVCVKLEVVAHLPRALRAQPGADARSRVRRHGAPLSRRLSRLPRAATRSTTTSSTSLDVTLAMARLLDGYERSRGDGPHIDERLFQLGVICALYHDIGYIRRANDTQAHATAPSTRRSTSRAAARFLQGVPADASAWTSSRTSPAAILHFTGYETPVAQIKRAAIRSTGSSAACSAPRTSSRRWPTAVTSRNAATGSIPSSSRAASRCGAPRQAARRWYSPRPRTCCARRPASTRTPHAASTQDLGGAYQYAQTHFGGQNLYMDAVKQNIRFMEQRPRTSRRSCCAASPRSPASRSERWRELSRHSSPPGSAWAPATQAADPYLEGIQARLAGNLNQAVQILSAARAEAQSPHARARVSASWESPYLQLGRLGEARAMLAQAVADLSGVGARALYARPCASRGTARQS